MKLAKKRCWCLVVGTMGLFVENDFSSEVFIKKVYFGNLAILVIKTDPNIFLIKYTHLFNPYSVICNNKISKNILWSQIIVEDYKQAKLHNVWKFLPYIYLQVSYFLFLVPYKPLNQQHCLKNTKPLIQQFVWYSTYFNETFKKRLYQILCANFHNINLCSKVPACTQIQNIFMDLNFFL